MTITLKRLKAIESSLMKLLNAQLSIRVGFRLRKFSASVLQELADLEAARMRLVRAHGEPVILRIADGQPASHFLVTPAKKEAFDDDFEALLEETVDLPDAPKLSLDELEPAGLSVADIANLEFLIADEGAATPPVSPANQPTQNAPQ